MADRKEAGEREKKRVTIWLTGHTLARLKDTAKARGKTQAELVEAGVLRELDAPSLEGLVATIRQLTDTVTSLAERVEGLEKRLPPPSRE